MYKIIKVCNIHVYRQQRNFFVIKNSKKILEASSFPNEYHHGIARGMSKVHERCCKGELMLESTRIDVYAPRSASRCARESWTNRDATVAHQTSYWNYRQSYGFVISWHFVNPARSICFKHRPRKEYRGSNCWGKWFISSFFHHDHENPVTRAATLRYVDRSISVHAYRDRWFPRSSRIYVTPFSS